MYDDDINGLIKEFIRRLNLYKNKYGKDVFWNLAFHLYTDELADWVDAQHYQRNTLY